MSRYFLGQYSRYHRSDGIASMARATLPTMEIDLRVHDVPPPTLLAFLEAAVVHPGQDAAGVASFAGFSPSTGKRALPTLEALGLVQRDGKGRYSALVSEVR